MGRTKGAGATGSGGGGGGGAGSAGSSGNGSVAPPPVPSTIKIKDMLGELHKLCHSIQEERSRGEHNLTNISKTHERMQQEAKISQYYKSKLKSLYNTALQDADAEVALLRQSQARISEIKALRDAGNAGRPIMRKGVLMSLLQQNALTLPLWIGKPAEKPPPLCGAIGSDSSYIAKIGDKVAAHVSTKDKETKIREHNWIIAEVTGWNAATKQYEVDDIDADEDSNKSHTISKRRLVPLPIWKANPETDAEALFPKDTLVLALYPQTTCFYRALIYEPPKKPQDDYSVLFEDTTYPDGYSPPLNVAQRYVIVCKEEKKK